MTVSIYHINHLMKSYFKNSRSTAKGNKDVLQSVNDMVSLSTAGRKRLYEMMKEQAIGQAKIQYKGK